ncbi:MAG: sulfite oxidase [Planctomycetaceae bacterium]|nr:sulfite oxidase [Planctomycetaceae bacterium]
MSQTRRQFLAASSLAAAASVSPGAFASRKQEQTAAELVTGKDGRMIVLKPYPAVLETPLPLLSEQMLTPDALLFVRNNSQPQKAATMQPVQTADWKVQLSGLLNRSISISLQQLREMEMTEYEMVLQCSGNGRSLFSKAAQTSGTQWGKGGMGNVRFRGVRLSTLLEKNGIEPAAAVRWVHASGADDPLPEKEDFLHSLPFSEVIHRSILAVDMNGGPIPAIHGGPVRLITPGVYATMNVKWLTQLSFLAEESTNYNHVPRYRVPRQPIAPGTEYEFTLENSSFNWNMKTKSVLLTPTEGTPVKAGRTTIKGVAFNDGTAKLTSVYVSLDQGQSWSAAKLTHSDSRYGWTQFQLDATFAAGQQHIWSRAVDEFGRTQPLNGSVAWNPRGYEWNGIDQIVVDVV